MNKRKVFTISEQIALQIRQDILNETYKKGDFLRETELSKMFGVSRGPIRQALAQLSHEGFIESKPNVGYRVSNHPNDEVFSIILELRKIVEVFIIKKVFEKLTESDIEKITELLEDIKEACKLKDVHQLILADYAFHKFFIKKYGDSHILAIWKALMSRMMMRYSRFNNLMSSYEEHHAILNAIKSGDLKKTIQCLEDNIQ